MKFARATVLLDSHHPVFLACARNAILTLQQQGFDVQVFDANWFGFPQWNELSEKEVISQLGLEGEGVTLLHFKRQGKSRRAPHQLDAYSRTYLSDRMKGELHGRPITSHLVSRALSSRIEMASALSHQLRSCMDLKNDLLVLRNGRSPWQKRLLADLSEENVNLQYYDFPFFFGPTHGMVGPWPVHDRVNYQRHFRNSISLSSNRKISSDWAASRKFLSRSLFRFDKQLESVAHQLTIFTSSTFEFISMPDIWNTKPFIDQYEGFEKALLDLKGDSREVVMRVHPNLRNGCWRVQFKDVKRILQLKAKYGLKVHWHFESANSYDLLDVTELVLVSISTIGLEALIQGKSVYTVGTTFYDQFGECRTFEPGVKLEAYEPDVDDASRLLVGFQSISRPIVVKDSPHLFQRVFRALLASRKKMDNVLSLWLEISNRISAGAGVLLSRVVVWTYALRKE